VNWKTEHELREIRDALLGLAAGLGDKLKAAEVEIADLRAEVKRLQAWRERIMPGMQRAISAARVYR
jgi:hypothetical protein